VDRIDKLESEPDIVHGNHAPELITALLHFPGAPGVFFCHDWFGVSTAPPLFPRILRYVAVDDTCRDRLAVEHGIPDERIRVLLNAVDLARFRPRGPLPERPRRALAYRGPPIERNYIATLEAACARAAIALDFVRGDEARPERLLPSYDLVFAKARCALEALAVGTAVVLCDVYGSGPMVSARELDELRRLNFGKRALRAPVEVGLISEQIARYNAGDATLVSGRIRETAARDALMDDILELYEEVLDEHSGRKSNVFPLEEARALAAYIRQLDEAVKREIDLDLSLAVRTRFRRGEGIAGRLVAVWHWARARRLLR
jgi:hypothetical protein